MTLISARLAAQRELLQPGDHLRGGDFFFGLAGTVPQIVGAQHHDGVGDSGLCQHVVVEAAQPAVLPDIVQDTIAAEPWFMAAIGRPLCRAMSRRESCDGQL